MFKIKMHVRDKKTHRTWIVYPYFKNIFHIWIETGERRFINCGKAGYSEYNDRGEPVLDSWIEQPFYVTFFNEKSWMT